VYQNIICAGWSRATPSETGKYVKFGGWEEWRLSDNGLIAESRGSFDARQYDRQVAEGR
jgi:hypothetical protein